MTIPTAPLVSDLIAATVSDLIAAFLVERGCKHVFGVVGAGNMRIFDAIQRRGYTQIVCCHGEQAAGQAAIGYYRVSGAIAPVLVTCGGGASNVVTAIVSGYMDSIPLFVIAGQESRRNDKLRAYGVQGWDLVSAVAKVTKRAKIETQAYHVGDSLNLSYTLMMKGRPGPVVIEVPMDVQGMRC